ncbi:MAG: hypothetical protein NVSMB64_15230 [Candidatus Velthaea sp.]
MNRFRIAATALLLGLGVSAASSPAFAQDKMDGMKMTDHAKFSMAPVNGGAPQLPLTLSVVVAGGGPASFDAGKLVGNLTGNGPITQAELASLTKKYGAENVTSFVKTFNFVINDSLKIVTAAGVKLPAAPAPDPTDGKELSKALYTAGVTPDGKYDVEYMLDALVTHPVHVQVMKDIDANPDLGPKADANYHVVLTQAVMDLKSAYKL